MAIMNDLVTIDLGQSGGIATYDGNRAIAWAMPIEKASGLPDVLSLATILATLSARGKRRAVFEDVRIFGGQGRTSGGNLLQGRGRVEATLLLNEFEIVTVDPRQWQKETTAPLKSTAIAWCQQRFPKVKRFANLPEGKSQLAKLRGKAASIQFASEHYPEVPLILPRCTAPSDGLADALSMLWWASYCA